MGRYSTRFRPPPVRVGLASAATLNERLVGPEPSRLAKGAGNFGMREARFGQVNVRLQINKLAGPNTQSGVAGVVPFGHTQRKRGFPAITSPIKGR